MKFCWTTITVQNMERSIAFSTDIVGMTVQRRIQFVENPSETGQAADQTPGETT